MSTTTVKHYTSKSSAVRGGQRAFQKVTKADPELFSLDAFESVEFEPRQSAEGWWVVAVLQGAEGEEIAVEAHVMEALRERLEGVMQVKVRGSVVQTRKEKETMEKDLPKDGAEEAKKEAAEAEQKSKRPRLTEREHVNGVPVPAAGSITEKLFNLFDEMTKAAGDRAPRKAAIEKATEAGYKAGSAQAAYANWSRYRGYTGKAKPEETQAAANSG